MAQAVRQLGIAGDGMDFSCTSTGYAYHENGRDHKKDGFHFDHLSLKVPEKSSDSSPDLVQSHLQKPKAVLSRFSAAASLQTSKAIVPAFPPSAPLETSHVSIVVADPPSPKPAPTTPVLETILSGRDFSSPASMKASPPNSPKSRPSRQLSPISPPISSTLRRSEKKLALSVSLL